MKTYNIAAAVLMLGAAAFPAAAVEFDVTPGTLARLIREKGTPDATVTLRGVADVRDLSQLRDLPANVRTLDMSGLSVTGTVIEGGRYMGASEYAAGVLPPAMLAGTSVTALRLPEGIVRLSDGCLALSRVTELTLPASVTEVGDYAFAGCRSLRKVETLGPVTFGKGAFRNCEALADLRLQSPVGDVPQGMFYGCRSLAEMPAGITSVGDGAFMHTGIRKATLAGVKSIGDFALAEMPHLEEVELDASGVRFGKGVFNGDAGLESLPLVLTDLPALLLQGTGVDFDYQLNVPVVDEAVFANNSGLRSVTFGEKVSEVRADAFRNCRGLGAVSVVDLRHNIPVTDADAFSGLENGEGRYNILLLVSSGDEDVWKADPVWGRFIVRPGGNDVSVIQDGSRAEMSAVRSGGRLTVTSSMPVERLQVFGLDGTVICDAAGDGSVSVSADVPAGDIIVVRAVSGRTDRIWKLQ